MSTKGWSSDHDLDELFEDKRRSPDAMSPHMMTLRDLAAESSRCVEFGVRRANSTVALLAGCLGEVHSWDIETYRKAMDTYRKIQQVSVGRWTFHIGDSLEAEFDWCDTLVLDGDHSYRHVLAELTAHGDKVRKYIALHDSTAEPDVLRAAQDWLQGNASDWKIKHHYKWSHGLLVLERKP